MIEFKLPNPVTTNTYYRRHGSTIHISKRGQQFKNDVRWLYKRIKPTRATDWLLDVDIHPRLTSKDVGHKTVIDLDNCLKCILDSLTTVLYVDDKQVKEIRIRYSFPIKFGGATVRAHNLNEGL